MAAGEVRRGRPPSVTIERILDAAIAVIDRDGVDGCTMRAVADEAGIAPMTIYRHVADKAQLLEAIPDHLLSGLPAALARSTSSLDALGRIADALITVFEAHPVVAGLFAHPRVGPNMVAAADICLSKLRGDGIEDEFGFRMVRAVVAVVVGETVTRHGAFDRLGVDLLLAGIGRHLTQGARP